MNVSCVECGPPPDAILHIPPPPLPTFLQRALAHDGQPACAAPCAFTDTPAVEYVELPRQGPALDDTWLLVLVSSCAGVLLLGALLALLLLKCKLPRSGKGTLSLDGPPLDGRVSKGCEAVLYPHSADSRMALWAMLTPRGTAHHLADGGGGAGGGGGGCARRPASPPPACKAPPPPPPASGSTPTNFDNSAFVDSDADGTSADAFPLGELSEGSPRVSPPTCIEHPNLPPLNLHPHGRPRRAPLSRQGSDAASPASPVVL
ncbi:uncharacterized protein LOC126183334 [Schistocerca cancellata]|uniref:uncharacterized protein LOC126183334 n=1 Tax=Schistocerca cancellata TaxID=274614 RepID=UPI0021197516|nr:uncharacterized protein LOC126183334 [Schistocerca cancellata]